MKIKTMPVVRDFDINYRPEEWDGEPGKVSIRQATTGDNIRVQALFSEQTQEFDDQDWGRVRLTRKWNAEEMKRYRCFLTVVGSTLQDEDGNALFPSSDGKRLQMSESAFNAVWDALPPALTDEIYGYVLRVNVQWDFNRGED